MEIVLYVIVSFIYNYLCKTIYGVVRFNVVFVCFFSYHDQFISYDRCMS